MYLTRNWSRRDWLLAMAALNITTSQIIIQLTPIADLPTIGAIEIVQ